MSGFLAAAGVLTAVAVAGAAILLPPGRSRALAMLAAVALFPVLILGDQWHTDQIVALREEGGRSAVLLLAAAALVAALGLAFRRWPLLIPLGIVAALPFRVPLEAGGETANLLVPLYLVIAGGAAATLWRDWSLQGEGKPTTPARWLARALVAVLALYALQTLYSGDFSKGLQNTCFFYVPFAVVFALITDVKWDRRTLALVLGVLALQATIFVLIGTVEYFSRELFWNDAVIRSNEFHTYFRVNSVFWDPNIYGRYLALVAVVAMAALLWARERRWFALLSALIGLLWFGLAQTFSESSLLALLAGLAMLAALRWNWRWTLLAVAVGIATIGSIIVASGKLRPEIIFSGRAALVEGGLELWTERPLWGYGSGGFQDAYREHRDNKDKPVSVSHTEPVTVLAEQGLIGFALYVALLVVALWTMGAGLFARASERAPPYVGRAAVLAAFVALLVHTMAYAGFYEDPITWVLLAVGASLAAAAARERAETA